MSLLTTLKDKIKTINKTKLFKSVMGLTLAAGITLGSAACAAKTPSTNSTNPYTSQTSTQTSQSQSNKNSSTQKWGNLVTSLLNDEELLANADECRVGLPVQFLKDEGYDLADPSKSFTNITFNYLSEPNNVYINVNVLNNDDYYTQYLIRYTLSDRDMQDYLTLQGIKDWHMNLVNAEIAKLYTPTLLVKSQISKKALTTLKVYIAGYNYMNKFIPIANNIKDVDIILLNVDVENQIIYIMYTPQSSNQPAWKEIKLKRHLEKVTLENDILVKPAGERGCLADDEFAKNSPLKPSYRIISTSSYFEKDVLSTEK